jgi:uncharacterized protein
MEMKIHQLTQVEPIGTANGSLRLAAEGDRPLLLAWFVAFATEVGEVIQQPTFRCLERVEIIRNLAQG